MQSNGRQETHRSETTSTREATTAQNGTLKSGGRAKTCLLTPPVLAQLEGQSPEGHQGQKVPIYPGGHLAT